MKKSRFKSIKNLDGTYLGKVKTIMCKSEAGFARQFTNVKNTKSIITPKSNAVKPFVNTAIMAIYDTQEK